MTRTSLYQSNPERGELSTFLYDALDIRDYMIPDAKFVIDKLMQRVDPEFFGVDMPDAYSDTITEPVPDPTNLADLDQARALRAAREAAYQANLEGGQARVA